MERKLSNDVREYIDSLNHPLYTGDFCAEWWEREPESVFINAPAALQQMVVEGFVAAVCAVMAKDKTKLIHGAMKTLEG